MPRTRTLPPHLESRRSGYHWRRRLPRPARPDDAPPRNAFLCLSLRTHVFADAKTLARRLTAMSDQVFAADAETTMAIAPDTQFSMLESLARFEIDAFERARAVAGPRDPQAAALELRREGALQDVLRRALHLGDREVARRPLRHVAARLGIALAETDEDWTALAYEATKVLLDVSRERARRAQGRYDHPTPYFRRAVGAEEAIPPRERSDHDAVVEPAALASAAPQADHRPASAAPVASVATAETSQTLRPSCLDDARPGDAARPRGTADPAAPPPSSRPQPAPANRMPVIVPADLDCPDGLDEAAWQAARIAARPPRVLVDRTLLSNASQAALAKARGITLTEAIELHYELIGLGYRAPFDVRQRRKPLDAEKRAASVEDRLSEDHKGKRRLALDFWPAVLGDVPVDEIPVDDVNDALDLFARVPNNHGRSEADRKKFGLVELVELADAKAAAGLKKVAAAQARGAPAEEVDGLRLKAHEKRISVSTYVKHARVLRAVGEMLWDMHLIDHNPFSICSWTTNDVADMQKAEGGRARSAWDDRIDILFRSPIYQAPLEDLGDPLFWAPLIARHQGLRMEECLQLGPDDFGSDKGVSYLQVRKTAVNAIKTLSSERRLPLHPQMVELGLLKLVEMRRQEGRIRLFPHLGRGVQKETFSANFSKRFAYYRRTNGCYWPGLDFHALRTTFHNDLLSDGQSDALRCRLMGHARTDEGDLSYGQSLGIEPLAERMKSIVVDVSMIRRPFSDQPSAARAPGQGARLRLVG